MIVGESVWGWLAHFMLAECGKRWQSRRQLIKFPECVYSLAFSPVHRNGELQIDGDLREFCEVVADQMYSVLHENDRFGAVLKLAQDAEVPWATRKKVGPSPLAQMSQGFENSKGDFASIQKFLKVVETASKSVLDKTAGQSTQLGLLGNRTFVLQKPPSRPYWSDHFKTYIYEQVLAPAAAGNLGSADYLVKVNEIHPNLNATRTSVTAARREDLDLRFCPRPFISDVFLYVPTNADAKSGNRECFMRVVGENLLSVDLNTLRITSPTAKNSGRIVQNTFVAQSIGWDENEHTKMYMTAEAKVVGAEWDIENPPVLILECLSVKDRTGTICNDEIQPINPDRVRIKIMTTSPKVAAGLTLPNLIAKAYFKSVAEIVASGLTGFGFRLEELVDRYPNRFPLTSSLRAFLDQMKSADPSLLSKFDTAINRGLLLKRGGATEVASMQTIEELKQLQIRTGNAALQPYEERVNPPNSTFAKGVAIRVAGAVSGGAAGGGSAAAGAFALASAPLVVLSAPFLIMVGAGTAIVAAAFVAWSLSESGSKAIDYCIKTATSYEQLVKEKLEMFDIAKETIDAYRTNQDLEEALIKIKEESGKKKQDKQDKSKKATKEEKVRQEMLEEIDKCILPVVNLRKACNNCIVLLTSGVKNSGKTRAFLELMNLPIDQKVKAPVGNDKAGATKRLFVGRAGLLDSSTTFLIADTPGINEKEKDVQTVVTQMQQAADLQLMFLPSTVRQEGEDDKARENDFKMSEEVVKTSTALEVVLVYSRQDQGFDEIKKRNREQMLEAHRRDCKTHDCLPKVPEEKVFFTAFTHSDIRGWDLDRPRDIVQHVFNFIDRRAGNAAASGFQRAVVTQSIRLADEPGQRCRTVARLDEIIKLLERATDVPTVPGAVTGEGTGLAVAFGGGGGSRATAEAAAARAKVAAQLPVLLEEMEEVGLVDEETRRILTNHGWKEKGTRIGGDGAAAGPAERGKASRPDGRDETEQQAGAETGGSLKNLTAMKAALEERAKNLRKKEKNQKP